ncbi:MAG: recombinase family protein [Lachnospiraceae bacterium]|nr:recombinase family protein [Lachnospiraceae bacterium]
MQEFKTACAYIRVSTDKQEELSPDAQKRLLLDYAKKNNISILNEHIFIENGISGKKAEKRPEFMKMISLAKSKEHPFDIILVWKYSRFARNQEESIVYKSLLKKNNVDVISVSEPVLDGPFGGLIERIIEWMDEYYSIRLSGEVMRGMTEKALRGGYQSTLPLGYKMDKSTGIPYIYKDEADIVKIIYEKYSSENTSFLEISRFLNRMGYKTKRGASFEARTVEYILQNPFYIGKVRWNRQHKEDYSIKDKSEWIIADAKHEPMFSNEFFSEIQDKIDRNRRHPRQRSTVYVKHWLSGMVKCSSCGVSLVGRRSNGIVVNYQCSDYYKGKCQDSHFVKTYKLEQAVYEGFLNVFSSKDFEFINKNTPNASTVSDRTIEKQLDRLKLKEKRIKLAYMDGIDSIEEYKENKLIIEKERAQLLEELNKVPDKKESKELMLKNIKHVYSIISDESQDMKTRAEALRSVVDHMVYNKENDSLSIFFYLANPLK